MRTREACFAAAIAGDGRGGGSRSAALLEPQHPERNIKTPNSARRGSAQQHETTMKIMNAPSHESWHEIMIAPSRYFFIKIMHAPSYKSCNYKIGDPASNARTLKLLEKTIESQTSLGWLVSGRYATMNGGNIMYLSTSGGHVFSGTLLFC